MRLDARIHQRLRVARLVALVVSETAETDEIQHHIFVVFLTVIERDFDDAVSRFGVVAVDVKNRRLRDMRGVGRINRAARVFGRSRKTDLVVDNYMNRAARSITRRLASCRVS